MNKFQKKKSKEIKEIMTTNRFGCVTYRQARRTWTMLRRIKEQCNAVFGIPVMFGIDISSYPL